MSASSSFERHVVNEVVFIRSFLVNAGSERKVFVHKSGQGLETLLQSLRVSSSLKIVTVHQIMCTLSTLVMLFKNKYCGY